MRTQGGQGTREDLSAFKKERDAERWPSYGGVMRGRPGDLVRTTSKPRRFRSPLSPAAGARLPKTWRNDRRRPAVVVAWGCLHGGSLLACPGRFAAGQPGRLLVGLKHGSTHVARRAEASSRRLLHSFYPHPSLFAVVSVSLSRRNLIPRCDALFAIQTMRRSTSPSGNSAPQTTSSVHGDAQSPRTCSLGRSRWAARRRSGRESCWPRRHRRAARRPRQSPQCPHLHCSHGTASAPPPRQRDQGWA